MSETRPLPPGDPSRNDLGTRLRQMIAALEEERQALAVLDADALFEAARIKEGLCEALAAFDGRTLDPPTRELAMTARELNEVNRRVRNLLAAHVSTRLEALGGAGHAYALQSSLRRPTGLR